MSISECPSFCASIHAYIHTCIYTLNFCRIYIYICLTEVQLQRFIFALIMNLCIYTCMYVRLYTYTG